jgi:predicted DNA-binding WGR domain protein
LSERLSIELQACDCARNRYRRWHVAAGQDLFGRWHARVTFGRIGCDGRTIRHDFVNEDDAAPFIRACLRRRATAEKRLAMCPRPRLNGNARYRSRQHAVVTAVPLAATPVGAGAAPLPCPAARARSA